MPIDVQATSSELAGVPGAALAFSFLHPGLAAAGAALVAIPIIIHLLNRRRFKTVQWAAMEFLLQALRRNRRRMRFESWLLLLTRCLVIGLLGIALARPVGCADTALARVAGREAGLHVFVIDNSASMAYRHERGESATHLEHARRLAAALVARLGGGSEQVAILSAAAPAEGVIAAPTFDLAAAGSAVATLPQTMRATDLAGALEQAAQIAAEAPPSTPKTLHVLTDDAAAALPDDERLAQAARAAAGHYRIIWHHLGAPGQHNRAVLAVRPAQPLVRRGFDTSFLAAVQQFGGVPAEANLAWRLDGQSVGSSQPVTPQAEAADATAGDASIQDSLADGRVHVLEASLSPADNFPPDDARRRVVEQVTGLPVLLVEGRRSLESFGGGAFLALALAPGGETGYVQVTRISDLELSGRPLSEYRALVLAGVGNIAEPTAEAIAEYVRAGGTLVLWMGEAVGADNYNATLLPRGLLPGPLVQRVSAPGEELIGFDFDPQAVHPYLGAFRGEERSGLDVPAIRQYWRIDLGADRQAEVVLRYLPTTPGTPGDAAVVTWPLGEGRVLTVTTAAGDPEWTLLPLKDNYVAFVHELLDHAVGGTTGGGTAWQTLDAGAPLVVPASLELASAPALVAPSGQSIELRREIREDGTAEWRSAPLEEVGTHELRAGDRTWPIAVNVPAVESDLRPLDQSAVTAALGDVELVWTGDALPEATAEAEQNRADFGWGILLAVLLLAGFECFLAMRFGRHRRVPGEPDGTT